jgi:hypothetical protein
VVDTRRRREGDDLDFRRQLSHSPYTFEGVARHVQVKNYDIRLMVYGNIQRRIATTARGNNPVAIAPGKYGSQTLQQCWMIIYKRN